MAKDALPTTAAAFEIPAPNPNLVVRVEVIADRTEIGGHIKARGHRESMPYSKAKAAESIGHVLIIGIP